MDTRTTIGDSVKVTKSSSLSGIYIGMTGTVEAIRDTGAMVRLSGGAVVYLPFTSYERIKAND